MSVSLGIWTVFEKEVGAWSVDGTDTQGCGIEGAINKMKARWNKVFYGTHLRKLGCAFIQPIQSPSTPIRLHNLTQRPSGPRLTAILSIMLMIAAAPIRSLAQMEELLTAIVLRDPLRRRA